MRGLVHPFPGVLRCGQVIRIQIQLSEEQAAILRRISAERRLPVAELIRLSVDAFIQREAGRSLESKVERAKRAAGRFASGISDVSNRHDRYVTERIGQHRFS